MRWIAFLLLPAVLLLAAACEEEDGVGGASDLGQACADVGEPLTLEGIAEADEGQVTVDVLCNRETAHSKYAWAVGGPDAGGFIEPLGVTDKNLIAYGLATCDDPGAPLPEEWELAPGTTEADLEAFANIARENAQQFLCD